MVDRQRTPRCVSAADWTRAMRHVLLSLTLAIGLILQSVGGLLAANALSRFFSSADGGMFLLRRRVAQLRASSLLTGW